MKAANVIEEAGETVKIQQMMVKINLEEDEEKLRLCALRLSEIDENDEVLAENIKPIWNDEEDEKWEEPNLNFCALKLFEQDDDDVITENITLLWNVEKDERWKKPEIELSNPLSFDAGVEIPATLLRILQIQMLNDRQDLMKLQTGRKCIRFLSQVIGGENLPRSKYTTTFCTEKTL